MNFVSHLEKKGALLLYLIFLVTGAKADASCKKIFYRFRYVF